MTKPNAAAMSPDVTHAELEVELRRAKEAFARGEFMRLTLQQIDRCIVAGLWPWPDESSG